MEAKDILVPTFSWQSLEMQGFQRQYVWPRLKADRFIESLLLGLPVPGIFLVREPSGVLLVLDGHQRLYTLQAYYQGIIDRKAYRLAHVQQRFVDKAYKDLDVEDRRRLDDSIIHATIIRQDEPTDDQSSIYLIFERLNTGGVNLQPQEVRVALYHGEFVRTLQHCNDSASWRQLYGKKSGRLKDMEMVLRFFAFLYYGKNYKSPMKDFLNRYMATNRHLKKQSDDELHAIFSRTSDLILQHIGKQAFRPQGAVNAAVVDSLMTGIAQRFLAKGDIHDTTMLKQRFDWLMDNSTYKEAVGTGTAQETHVQDRLTLAQQAFADVP